ncbi:hypothetical protein NDJ21_00545 [Vibrio alginolyticus]|uniref:hypothetical protein n=1 Tax=Vibrio alginolyticus TaxID=663 RepID=UPI00215E99C3|nr:hypothetical protein [Vibrio alginolyticus]EKY4202011.1 hypothetical protein [Vibrio alginolyticus]MCS0226496.1 hypothetical protein [Vibrio alginolyticus]
MRLGDYPFDESLQTKLDWVEISCILSEFKNYYYADLVGLLEASELYSTEDIGEEDASVENEITLIISEFQKRCDCLGDSYPFEFDEDVGIQLKSIDLDNLTPGQLSYVYCLYFSHICSSRLFIESQVPTNRDRDIMQIISTIALCGYLEYGNSVSFGFPRPEGTDFYPAFEKVLTDMGEGRLKTREQLNRYLAAKAVKDAGIDVISWKADHNDPMPGSKQVYFAQVASGNNWESKAVLEDITEIQNHWLDQRIPSRINDAMCIPFDFEQEGDYPLEDYYAIQSDRFGLILNRLRLPKLLEKGLRGVETRPELMVGRIADIEIIYDYVSTITTSLEQAA